MIVYFLFAFFSIFSIFLFSTNILYKKIFPSLSSADAYLLSIATGVFIFSLNCLFGYVYYMNLSYL